MSAQGFYSIIQYSPVPDRFEFINIGVVLVVPLAKYVRVRFSKGVKRIERVFGKPQGSYLSSLKEGIQNRVNVELSEDFSRSRFEKFAESRANDIRFSRPMSMLVEEPNAELEELFNSLVGEPEISTRRPKVITKLRKELDSAGVVHLLERPEPVPLPRYGITIEAPYAYQNGAYNLIDPVRLGGDPDEALKEASKRAVEGQWLAQQTEKRLIVVGDLADQNESGIALAVDDMMRQHGVKFYRIDHLSGLVDDIRHHRRAPSLNS